MKAKRYPTEVLDANDDNGTMPQSLAALEKVVVGHKILRVETGRVTFENSYGGEDTADTVLVLDNGMRVGLVEVSDCCAFTEIENLLLHPESVDHVILGVGTTNGYSKWHIYADFGDVLELNVNWSCGNPFYYGYGFDILVDHTTLVGEVPKFADAAAAQEWLDKRDWLT